MNLIYWTHVAEQKKNAAQNRASHKAEGGSEMSQPAFDRSPDGPCAAITAWAADDTESELHAFREAFVY